MKVLVGTSFAKEVEALQFTPESRKDILRSALMDKYAALMEKRDHAVAANLPKWIDKWEGDMKTVQELLKEINNHGRIENLSDRVSE